MLAKDNFVIAFFVIMAVIAIGMVGTGTFKGINKSDEPDFKYEYAKYVDSQLSGPIIYFPEKVLSYSETGNYDEKNKKAVKYLTKEKNDIKCFEDEKEEAGLKHNCGSESVLSALGHQGWQVYESRMVPMALPLAQMQQQIKDTTGVTVEYSDLLQAAGESGSSAAQAYYLKRILK